MTRQVQFDDEQESKQLKSQLHPILQIDLEIIEWISQQKEDYPNLTNFIHATASKYRTQDISLLIWLIFIGMLPEFSFPYFWICMGNFVAVILLQYLIKAPRPIDINLLLMEYKNTDPDTYGFPAIDTHMAMVVILPAILEAGSMYTQAILTLCILYIGLTRIFIGSRFISQVIGSWITGVTGLLIGNHGHLMLKAYKLPFKYNFVAIAFMIFSLVGIMAIWVENNESRLLGVKKDEYLRVLSNILATDAPASGSSTTDMNLAKQHQTRLQKSLEKDEEEEEEKKILELAGKKDSFYYLMHGMRQRAKGTRLA